MHKYSLKCIDSIVATLNVLQCIEGSQLLETNEAINTDQWLNIIDINMKLYFDKELVDWDKINKSMIDPNKRINWERFHEITEELLDSIPIEELVFIVT